MSTPTPPPTKPVPESSPNLIVGLVLGGLGTIVTLTGPHVLGFLLGLAGLIVSIVGLTRNEPQRGLAPLGMLLSIIAIL